MCRGLLPLGLRRRCNLHFLERLRLVSSIARLGSEVGFRMLRVNALNKGQTPRQMLQVGFPVTVVVVLFLLILERSLSGGERGYVSC